MYKIDYERISVQRVPKGLIVRYPFSVSNIHFVCSFVELSCELPDISDVAHDLIVNEGIIEKAEGTFWIDFDSVVNLEQGTPYEPMKGLGWEYRHWIYMSDVLCEIIAFHQQQYNCELFFAEPANERLARAYEQIIVPNLLKDGYNYYVDESEDGGWYVFRKV